VGVSHNNMHAGAIYVTSDGTWKLGGLEHITKFSETTMTKLSESREHREPKSIAPEEKAGKVLPGSELGHARDVYAFAVMVENWLEKLEPLGDLTKTFELRIRDECLEADPRKRPNMQSLLENRLFTTELLKISAFLEQVALKSMEDRKAFFSQLLPKLLYLPEELVAKRLVPRLLSRFVLLDQTAIQHVLPSVLTPRTGENDLTSLSVDKVQPLFSESVFQRYIIPKVVKIFTVHDYHVHMLMLTYFTKFVHLVSREHLETDILPQALLGLRDTSNEIAALSLHLLGDMVTVLGREAVIGGKCKTFFKESLPKTGSVQENSSPKYPLNNRYSNVSGVLPKMKLVELTNMRDTDSTKTAEIDPDRAWKEQEKKKEREMKREQMRRQREERKNSRELAAVAAKDEIKSVENMKLSSERIIDNDTEDTLEKLCDRLGENEAAEISFDNSDWSETVDSSSVNVMDEDHWSDLENDTKNDSDISEEIEKELKTMELSKNPKSTVIKSQSETIIKTTGKPLKLQSSQKTNTNNVPTESNWEEPSQKLKLSAHSKAAVSNIVNGVKSSKSSQQLGSEFDIKSLEIKVSGKEPDPFDFFADMTPSIQKTSVKLDTNLKAIDTQHEGQNALKPSLFGVAEGNLEETDGSGWGDDDW
ncbi:hypothetical protein DPMN_145487, partial [Dreissena polymorpha]